jgi:hypothetical protein
MSTEMLISHHSSDMPCLSNKYGHAIVQNPKCMHNSRNQRSLVHFPPLTATLGGGGKYIPVDPASPPPALLGPAAISSSTFLSALSNPGLRGLPGKVGLLSANLVEKFGLLGATAPFPVSFLEEEALLEEPKWFRSGRSFVPPRRLNANVLGVWGLRAEEVDGKLVLLAAGEEGVLESSLSDMAGSLASTVGESRWA